MARPNPIRLEWVLNSEEQVDLHRHPSCDYYEKCLDKACLKKWKSFTCIDCSLFRKYKKIRRGILEGAKRYAEKHERILGVKGKNISWFG